MTTLGDALLNHAPEKQKKLLIALIGIYGDDINTMLNGVQEMATRLAIAGEVEPEAFAAGVKHHWDSFVDHVNALIEKAEASIQ